VCYDLQRQRRPTANRQHRPEPKIFRIFESTRLTGLAFLIAGRCTDVDGWIKISLGIIGAVFSAWAT
jgi:hypothetical protein